MTAPTMGERHAGRARRPRSLTVASTFVAATALLVACSSDPPDPAEVRHQQVRARLEATFSKSQASCILDALDEPTMKALVRTTALDPSSKAFAAYSNVVVLCTNKDAAATTNSATTTTAAG